jgi:peptide/nickel transport system substrate-binding protein
VSFGKILLTRVVTVSLILSSTGCTGAGRKVESQDCQSSTVSGAKIRNVLGSIGNVNAQFPNPGRFKLVELKANGATEECWQARGKLGQFGGTLTVSTFGSGPKTFNYWAATDVESAGIGLLMFEALVELDPWTGQVYPRLAKSFSISKDRLEYTFVLRKGLVWSDGHPLEADDVVFTFDKLIKQGFGNASLRDTISVAGHFPKVQKLNNLTVKFTTDQLFAPFLNNLSGIRIAPKHILEPVTARPVKEFDTFWNINADPGRFVVSGPFKLARYVPSQRVELVANPHYGMVDAAGKRLPYLAKIVDLIVPDQNTQLLKFYGNELDMLDIRSVRGPDASSMKQREQSGNFKMFNLGADDGTTFLMFNLNRRRDSRGKYYVDPIKQKWFNDPFFRQAVSHAIDRVRLVNNILRGVGLPLYGPESPSSLYFNKLLKAYGQNLELSAKLLEKAGFVKRDDCLFDSDKHPVEFTLYTNAGNTARDATCIMIAHDLKPLGIKVNYKPIDFNNLVDRTHQSLDWEAIVMGLTGDRIEPYNGANIWRSDGRMHMFDQRLPDKYGNINVFDARFWELEIDRCFNKGATTFDIGKRRNYFDRYQEVAYELLPIVYLYTVMDIAAVRNVVHNYMPTPLGVSFTPKGSLHNIEEIYTESVQSRRH